MAFNKKKSVLDELIGDADDEDSSSEEEEQPGVSAAAAGTSKSGSKGEAGGNDGEQPVRSKPKALTLEDLQRAGFKGGPSVLLMRAPENDGQANFSWSDGKAAKEKEPEKESWQERQQTHYAATEGAEQTGILAVKAGKLTERLREDRKLERQQQDQERKMSFSQKEKRKREEGKVSRGGSYVEDEKRLGRKFGVFSGFD